MEYYGKAWWKRLSGGYREEEAMIGGERMPTKKQIRFAIERDHWTDEELGLLLVRICGRRWGSDRIMRCLKDNILKALKELGWNVE